MEQLNGIMARWAELNGLVGTSESAQVYPDESIEAEPQGCPVCGGHGWTRADVPVGHPLFGTLKPCPTCAPMRERDQLTARVARVSAECGLSAHQRGLTFANFDRYQGNERAAMLAARFSVEPGSEWLVIAGQTGNGKTHLLSAIANTAVAAGIPTLYAFVPDLLDWLRQGNRRAQEHDDDDGDFHERFDRVRRVPLLLLDDLAAEARNEWVRERMEGLIDYRYRERLPIVCTSNRDLRAVRSLSDRILSRLERYDHSTIVVNHAEPYYLWKARQPVR